MLDSEFLSSSVPDRVIFQGRVAWIGMFRCPPSHPAFHQESYYDWHHLITFPRTAVELHMRGKGVVVSSPNIAVFYNHGQEYSRKVLSDRGDWCEWFQFCPSLLLDAMKHYEPGVVEHDQRPFQTNQAPIATQRLLLERQIIYHLLNHDVPDGLWVDEMALLLLEGILTDYYRTIGISPKTKSSTQRGHQALAIEAQKLLFQHMHETLTLPKIAQSLHTSPFHLARVFRQQVGLTLHAYLEELRLRTALERLPAYKKDLATLALTVGYKNHSHFTHAFHRKFGLPPSLYDPSRRTTPAVTVVHKYSIQQ